MPTWVFTRSKCCTLGTIKKVRKIKKIYISYFILQNSSAVVKRKKSSYGNNLGLFASNNCSKGRKAISSCLKAITSVTIQSNAGRPGITPVGTHNLNCFDFQKTYESMFELWGTNNPFSFSYMIYYPHPQLAN